MEFPRELLMKPWKQASATLCTLLLILCNNLNQVPWKPIKLANDPKDAGGARCVVAVDEERIKPMLPPGRPEIIAKFKEHSVLLA